MVDLSARWTAGPSLQAEDLARVVVFLLMG